MIERRDPRCDELIDPGAELETLASGFTFTEGPVWVPAAGCLLFCDVPSSRRLRWDPDDGVSEVCHPTSLGDGMTLDRDGGLIVCEGETGQITRMSASGDGSERVVLASHYRGRRLNSPNDVVVRSDGSVYFTDPWWPHLLGRTVTRELDFQGVFRSTAGSELELLIADMDFPNGLCFSPDESVLYVNDSTPGAIRAFDVAPDGSLSGDRLVADGLTDESGHVDGMKCDERGNVWVTGPGGIWILDPAGTALGVIETPERTGNLHWGGPDWRWLFVCCSTALLRIPTRVAGRREPFML